MSRPKHVLTHEQLVEIAAYLLALAVLFAAVLCKVGGGS